MTEVVKEALIIEPDLSATPSCGHTALCLDRFDSRIRFGDVRPGRSSPTNRMHLCSAAGARSAV
ncbi:hypothetical protein [Rhodococcus sp. I2R]|uniref:hypothetical protein n=1 Tax=Rhodococcus sp. I2R TaxID=2855445 RepID=UPI001E4FD4AD|nr:hypothetical protein [Rhodococcus sp. I2R]MCC8927664.1 hypothetical protein [Rhodococcus sp. I2R]